MARQRKGEFQSGFHRSTFLQYKGGVERRVTDDDTSAVHYEFGRYCPKDYVIKVTIENMLIHGPDNVDDNNGCFDDVVAQFRYKQFGIESVYQICGEYGENFWTEKKDL